MDCTTAADVSPVVSDTVRMMEMDPVLPDADELVRRQIHFFVRPMATGRTMMITGDLEEPLKAVLNRISGMTETPVSEQRLICNGKQLELEKTLEECEIENDSIVHVAGRLLSGGFPAAARLVDYMVSVMVQISESGETMRFNLNGIGVLVSRNLGLTGFVEVFTASCVPFMLASLYMGGGAEKHLGAEGCVSHILDCCRGIDSQHCSSGLALKFCKELRKVGCESNDSLYVQCRSTLGYLLENVGLCYGSGIEKRRVSVRDIFSFVPELADRVLHGLDHSKNCPTPFRPCFEDVKGLITFLKPVRSRIRAQLGLSGYSDLIWRNVNEEEEEDGDDTLLAEEVDYVRLVFFRLLSKMEECFGSMAEILGGNEQHTVYDGWSLYLDLLKELYEISKVFDGAEEEFWRVLTSNKSMLSVLVVRFVKTEQINHRWILENRSVTNFESRRHFAMMLLPNDNVENEYFYDMIIDRSHLLAESFEYIGPVMPQILRHGLYMEFKNEEATGPGVLREWFILMCREVFNPQTGLFLACPNDRRRFYPNPASNVHPRHLEYFQFTGRIIALALMRKLHVGIVFDRVFFTQLAGNNVTLEDIRDADPDLYRSCKQILEMDADFIDSDALGLTFARESEVLGRREVIELFPGGRNLALNSKNREMYVHLLVQSCFGASISEQVSHFAMGFADIMWDEPHHEFFRYLELGDLDCMLHGSENAISIEDWKAHTNYEGFEETDSQISWFWEIVGRMSAKQRMILLFFWTSVQYLPVEGFRGLPFPLVIARTMEPSNHLPSSHTCFYQLCFPCYPSKSVMQERFRVITQEHIACSFGTS